LSFQPQANQCACGVGGELDAGASLFEAFSLFEYDNLKAATYEGQSCGQPADPGACDDDNTRRRQALLRQVSGDDVV
jgi:hypothetical protein